VDTLAPAAGPAPAPSFAIGYSCRVRVYGLTGNIGSGKSTAARLFGLRGAPVVDADEVARYVVEPGKPALREIEARFPGVLASDGSLDRKGLGARVFGDTEARRALEGILHPRIGEEVSARLSELSRQGAPFALYEAALIVENGLDDALDGLIVVTAPEAEQVRRVVARDGLDEAGTRARIAAQLPAAVKAAKADFVIDNGGTLEALEAAVDRVLARLEAGYARRK